MARITLGTATLAAGGGIALLARMTARIIREAGHELHVASYLDGPEIEAPFPIQACGGGRLRFAAAMHRNALRADLCFYDSPAMARAHPRLPGFSRPYAVWMLGIESWEGLRPGALKALHGARCVLPISRHTLSRFQKLHGPLPQARLCHLATAEDEAAIPSGQPREPLALIVGRIDRAEAYKGHKELIEAWPAVLEAVPDAKLAIAGGGSGLEDIRRLAAASPAAAAIEIHGFVAPEDLNALWQRASLFAMPSRGEGFGLVYVEAMRLGLPVIASVHDAGREVVLDGVTGFTVDLDQPPELSTRIAALLGDPALARRMGEAGQRRWEEYFRFARLKARLEPVITSLLEAG